MALTYTVENTYCAGGRRRVNGTITFDSAYVTAGEPFSPNAIGLVQLTDLQLTPGQATPTTGHVPVWNRSTSAPTARVIDFAGVEIANGVSLATLVCGFEAAGY